MKRNIGWLEAQLLAYAQMRRWTTVRTADLRKPMRLNADQERKLFSRLARWDSRELGGVQLFYFP